MDILSGILFLIRITRKTFSEFAAIGIANECLSTNCCRSAVNDISLCLILFLANTAVQHLSTLSKTVSELYMLLYFVHVNVFLFISLCYILNKAGRIFFGDGES